MMCGGTGDLHEATPEVQELADGVKSDLETQSGEKFSQFIAISYKSQVVAGTNYFIKVQVEDSKYVHLRVFQPLPHANSPPELTAYQLDKAKDDPVEYFN